MKRRRAREYALQALFQFDFTGEEPDINRFFEGKDEDKEVIEFSENIIKGTIRNLPEIDSVIKETTEHWGIDRMAAVDRNILRAATYELLFLEDIPPAVAINEAIEIAKKYSTAESAAFINGILDRISRTKKRH
jgi:N utilization substance protein B